MRRILQPVKTLRQGCYGIDGSTLHRLGHSQALPNLRVLDVAAQPLLTGNGASWIETPNMQQLVGLDARDTDLNGKLFSRLLENNPAMMPHLQECQLYMDHTKRNEPNRLAIARALERRNPEFSPQIEGP